MLTSTTERQMEQVDRLTAQNNMLVGELGKLQAVSDELKGTNRALESTRGAANSGGPGGPTGPLGTLSRTHWILSRWGKCHRKRSHSSAGTFGSTVRSTAAH